MKSIRNILTVVLISKGICCFSQTWNAMGTDPNGCIVFALKEWNNHLYAGGCLSINNKDYGICSFDGLNYDFLDDGLQLGGAFSLAVHNNILYAGGDFLSAGNVSNSALVAGWNGTSWSSANNFAVTGTVYSMASYNGELYAGGNFLDMGFNPNADRSAKWNGTSWSQVGAPMIGMQTVYAMTVYKGQLYVGGNVGLPGGPNNYYYNLVRWNGTKWDSVGVPIGGTVYALAVDTIKNELYAAGSFLDVAGIPTPGVAKWNDTVWTSMASPTDTLWATTALVFFNGELYAGGSNSTITGQGDTLNNIYKWNGTKWVSPVGGGTNIGVTSLEVYQGNLYVGGGFTKVGTSGYNSSGGGITANYLACYGNTCPQGVGIQELQVQTLKFKVYPNPTKGELNVLVDENGNKEYVLKVYNSIGKKVLERKISKQSNINTSGYAKGMYQVEVCAGRNCHAEKFVIE